jgi:hypothetical protein
MGSRVHEATQITRFVLVRRVATREVSEGSPSTLSVPSITIEDHDAE